MVLISLTEDFTRHHGNVMLLQHGLAEIPAAHTAVVDAREEVERAAGRGQLDIGALAQGLYPQRVPLGKGAAHLFQIGLSTWMAQ